MSSSASDSVRAAVTTVRLHQRFLLRQMQFHEQFAAMYKVRTRLLRERVMARTLQVHAKRGSKTASPPDAVRVLGLVPGVDSLVVGTLYKTMKNFVGFLSEYQKELVRIEAGDDEDGEDMGDGVGEEGMGEIGMEGQDLERQPTVGNSANMCSSKDSVVLEDESGRVELSGINPDLFVTGMVVAVYGTLLGKGKFEVKELFFPGTPEASPRAFPRASAPPPCYVAFVCGLGFGCLGEAPLAIGKMLAYLVGDRSLYAPGADADVPDAANIAKVIIGGNLVEPTEEHKLKNKVRLDPADHTRVSDTANKLTAANSMKSADAFLSVLAESVEIDVMPGDTDPSNAYLPQQPLHPVLLRATSKKPSARFVTNPYDCTITPAGANANAVTTRLFVTSGQNTEDMLRQTNHGSVVSVLRSLLECGCACPTAPNTLLCYPFTDKDPFTFPEAPHALVSCNSARFETAFEGGVRYVAVPSFSTSGEIVLMDVASPEMNTVSVVFTV